MAAKKPNSMTQSGAKVPIKDLAECITCTLCNGYFIDATTIVECLHTFCRSCIVKYLEKNKYCPVCDVQVHKTKPLLNLRADTTIQNVVYKLVPRLYQNEMKRRKVYYDTHPEVKPTLFEINVEELYQNFLTPEETLCLTLSNNGCKESARYFRCPTALNVAHIKKLIRAKYDLTEHHRVEVLHNQDCLSPELSLMDVAYIYSWKRNTPLELTYKIYECRAKKLKPNAIEPSENSQFNTSDTSNNNNWKEVQLRISESGEMSITGIQDANNLLTLLDKEGYKQEVIVNESIKIKAEENTKDEKVKTEKKALEEKVKSPKKPKTPSRTKKLSLKKEKPQDLTQNNVSSPKKELPELKLIHKPKSETLSTSSATSTISAPFSSKVINSSASNSVTDTINKVLANNQLTLTSKTVDVPNTYSLGAMKTVFSTINSTKCSTMLEDIKKSTETTECFQKDKLKRKLEDQGCDLPLKVPKPTILNHLMTLSNNHPLKKHSKLNRNGEHPKSVDLVEKVVSSACLIGHCISSSVKVTSGDHPAKPIILNQSIIHLQTSKANLSNSSQNKRCSITVPSYPPKSVSSSVVSVPRPIVSSQPFLDYSKSSQSVQSSTKTTPVSETNVTRSNPASNGEGKVGTSLSKAEVAVSSFTSVPSHSNTQFLVSSCAPVSSYANAYSLACSTSAPFLLNSAISTALKHPGITTFSTQLTPSTGFNHSSYLPQPTNAPPNPLKTLLSPSTTASHYHSSYMSPPSVQATPHPIKTLLPPTTTVSQPVKSKSNTPLGYKTLRDPPKSWNAQIAKANLNVKTAAANQALAAAAAGNSGAAGGKYSDLKNVRPAKFFKQRNMPRYLGNPASGVKPMFPVQTSPDKDNNTSSLPAKQERSEIKKHSIVKIDPKTLKPISEKAPETSNLSNISSSLNAGSGIHQQNSQEQRVSITASNDLKINTSSVSIFNPLKLQQNSPKNDRKSPKSPHSPKVKSVTNTNSSTTTTVTTCSIGSTPAASVPLSPTGLKRDKPNVTFTPPNPFVPNMAAPALSPNQFLFPTGAPPGFPTYDPRVMAAYHSLWYSQRLAAAGFPHSFPGAGGLSLGSLTLPPSVSHQQHSPGVSPKHNTSSKSSSPSQSRSGTVNSTSAKSPGLKKPKETTTKSLETALEKLTQNKVNKESSKNGEKSSNTSVPCSTPNSSAILPPVVPNIESISSRVPLSNHVEDSNKLDKVTIDREKKDENKTIRSDIKSDKSPKDPKKVETSKHEKGIEESKELAEKVSTISEPSKVTTVTFSNVMSLTNSNPVTNDENVKQEEKAASLVKEKDNPAELVKEKVGETKTKNNVSSVEENDGASSSKGDSTLQSRNEDIRANIETKHECDMSSNADSKNDLKNDTIDNQSSNDKDSDVKITKPSDSHESNEEKPCHDDSKSAKIDTLDEPSESVSNRDLQKETSRNEDEKMSELSELSVNSSASVCEKVEDVEKKSEAVEQSVVPDEKK